ncbi:hypothetical protein SCG7086_AI_00110 [Chlamydiales bacterium SCGC AG-110-P3]|nr:hypothetical protein SCG7086_AI_00110 [Chlamydiales bacterium SCGC AG-110-P3]
MTIFSTKSALSKLGKTAVQPSPKRMESPKRREVAVAPLDQGYPPSVLLDRLKIQHELVTNTQEAKQALEHLTAYHGILGCDLETMPLTEWGDHPVAGLDPHISKIRTVQFGTDSKAFVFDMNRVPLACLQPLWSKPLVFHNATFDVKFLLSEGIRPLRVGCTQAMDLILRGGGAWKKLSNLCEEKLNLKIQKELQRSDWSQDNLSSEQIAYAALDAVLVRLLCTQQIVELRQRDMMRIASIIQRAIPAVASMELAGIPFDWDSHQRLVASWRLEEEALSHVLRDKLGIEDLSNMKDVQQWFAEYFRQNKYEMTYGKTGAPKLGKVELARYKDDPIVETYLNFACLKTRLSTFGDTLKEKANPVTDRVHPMFLHGKASTGRFATSGPNTQNFPRGAFRQLIKPSSGRVFVVADYSQIELRLVAIVAKEERMLEAYRNGLDLHRLTASSILDVLPEQVSKEQRTCAKAVNFGFIYGQREKGFMRVAKNDYGLDISYSDAQKYRENFFQAYPAIALWHEAIEKQLQDEGKVRTLNGWERNFWEKVNGLVVQNEKRIKQKRERIHSLLRNIEAEEGVLVRHKIRSGNNPEDARTKDLIAKKKQVIATLNRKMKSLEYEVRGLEVRTNAAKKEKNILFVPRLLQEKAGFLFAAYNLPIQGLGCELMSVALSKTHQRLFDSSAEIVNCIHDELVVECAVDDADWVQSQVSEAMEEAFKEMFPEYLDTIIGLVEVSIGQNWGDAK